MYIIAATNRLHTRWRSLCDEDYRIYAFEKLEKAKHIYEICLQNEKALIEHLRNAPNSGWMYECCIVEVNIPIIDSENWKIIENEN